MMKSRTLGIAVILAATFAWVAVRSQTTGGTSFRIERLDPALDEIVSPDVALDTLVDRFADICSSATTRAT